MAEGPEAELEELIAEELSEGGSMLSDGNCGALPAQPDKAVAASIAKASLDGLRTDMFPQVAVRPNCHFRA